MNHANSRCSVAFDLPFTITYEKNIGRDKGGEGGDNLAIIWPSSKGMNGGGAPKL